jgi:transposase
MAYRATNTEHAGDKRGCSSYCGRRVEAKAGSRVKRREADAAIVRREAEDAAPPSLLEAINGPS